MRLAVKWSWGMRTSLVVKVACSPRVGAARPLSMVSYCVARSSMVLLWASPTKRPMVKG